MRRRLMNLTSGGCDQRHSKNTQSQTTVRQNPGHYCGTLKPAAEAVCIQQR